MSVQASAGDLLREWTGRDPSPYTVEKIAPLPPREIPGGKSYAEAFEGAREEIEKELRREERPMSGYDEAAKAYSKMYHEYWQQKAQERGNVFRTGTIQVVSSGSDHVTISNGQVLITIMADAIDGVIRDLQEARALLQEKHSAREHYRQAIKDSYQGAPPIARGYE